MLIQKINIALLLIFPYTPIKFKWEFFMFNFLKQLFHNSNPTYNKIQKYQIYFHYTDVQKLEKLGDKFNTALINGEKTFYIYLKTIYKLKTGMIFYMDCSAVAYKITNKINETTFEAEIA